MNDRENYFLDGYLRKTFRSGANLERLNEVIRELREKPPRDPYRWEEKYAFSHDLRPEVFAYDDVFLDILFENRIPELFREVVGSDLHLAHIQLRLAKQGDSYMDWHRDTHAYGRNIVGNAPPVHKLIYYPQENRPATLRLKILPGSHNRFFQHRLLDTLQCRLMRHDSVMGSNSGFLIFNTLILHAAAAEKQPEGSFRLIYSFCHEAQLGLFTDQGNLHEAYRRRLAEEAPAVRAAMTDAAG
jgi:hypothetical protein